MYHFLSGADRRALASAVAVAMTLGVTQAQPRIIIWGNDSLRTNAPSGLTDVKAVSAGYLHCLALRSNGVVLAWGDNSLKQTNIPASLAGVVAIAAGEYHSLALRSNGTVVAWGFNNYGQTNVPAGLTSVMAIAAGSTHSLALRSNGTVVAWGGSQSVITNVPAGLTGVKAISASEIHSLALRSNGTLVAWGASDSGVTNTPTGMTNLVAMAAGYHHNLAVRSNGTVAAWELDVYGESTVPPGLSGVAAVAGGYFFSMALKSNGTVVAWGQDFSGQTNIPPGLTNVTAIATPTSPGGDYCMALTPSPLCPPGLPDNFECRQLLVGSNLNFTVSTLAASSEPNEPPHFGFQDAGKSVWYAWTPPFTGGAVITASSDFKTPCLGVYTGATFAAFNQICSNNTAFFQSRVAFNAVAGATYQIAVDGTTFGGSPGTGNFTNISLVLTPPPANDMFSNRTVMPPYFYETSGSFIGATRELGEPFHTNSNGSAAFQQTLWWTWTAPTNLGVSSFPVRLFADSTSLPPNLGVYTGSSVSNLSAVPMTSQTNGMSRLAGFTALSGSTYQIALGGQQDDPLGITVSPRFGNYRLRLNLQALVLGFANINPTNNPDLTTSFGANLLATNFGSASSGPLRGLITLSTGISVKGQDAGFITNSLITLLATNLPALSPGQGVSVRVKGVIPAPTTNNANTLGVGYGAYGALQEQVDTNSFTIDQALLLFGNWPELDGVAGPGGGVVRLDPSVTGAGFNPLSGVAVLGPASVTEGIPSQYSGRATYASGFQFNFTNTVWNTTRGTITAGGLLTTGIVISNTPATLNAKYSSGGFTFDAFANISILNMPPPNLVQAKVLTNKNFSFLVQGVTNRKHVLEAATILTNPVPWSPIATNILTNGTWNFLESTTNFPARFYRARESD